MAWLLFFILHLSSATAASVRHNRTRQLRYAALTNAMPVERHLKVKHDDGSSDVGSSGLSTPGPQVVLSAEERNRREVQLVLIFLMLFVGLGLASCLCVHCFFLHGTSREADGTDSRAARSDGVDSVLLRDVFEKDRYLDEETDGSINWVKANVQLEPNVFGSITMNTEYLMLVGYSKNRGTARTYRGRTFHCGCMFVLAVFVLVLQFIFAGWMIKSIAKNEYAEKLHVHDYNQFWEWRKNDKDGNQTSYEGETWAHWACKGSDWSWEESKIDDYKKYNQDIPFWPLATIDKNGNLMPVHARKGIVFGVVAIFLWSASVVKALRSIAAYIMLMLPSTEVVEMSASSPRHLPVCKGTKGLTFVFGLLRTLAICLLWLYGAKFLAYTDNLKDFILNTVALQFVIDIPDIIFMTMASNVDKQALEKFQDTMNISAWVPKKLWQLSAAIAVVITVILTLVGCYYLRGFSDSLWHGVLRQLCAKNPMDSTPNKDLTNIGGYKSGELQPGTMD